MKKSILIVLSVIALIPQICISQNINIPDKKIGREYLYKYKNDTLIQIISITFLSEEIISFSYKIVNENNNSYYCIQGKANLKNGDAEIDENEDGSFTIVVTGGLDEIEIASTVASFEPTLDYIVAKVPRFPFDKFADANRSLSTQMKATGEVMSIGKSVEEVLLKGIRSLENRVDHIELASLKNKTKEELIELIKASTDERIYQIAEALRIGVSIEELYSITKIERFFLEKINNIVLLEEEVRNNPYNIEVFKKAKTMGFADSYIAKLYGVNEIDIYKTRRPGLCQRFSYRKRLERSRISGRKAC